MSACLKENTENKIIKTPNTLQIGYKKEIISEKPKNPIIYGKKTDVKIDKISFLTIFIKEFFSVKHNEIKVVKHPTKITKNSSKKHHNFLPTKYKNGISLTKLSGFFNNTKFPNTRKKKTNPAENRLDKKACFLLRNSPLFAKTKTLMHVFNAT